MKCCLDCKSNKNIINGPKKNPYTNVKGFYDVKIIIEKYYLVIQSTIAAFVGSTCGNKTFSNSPFSLIKYF